MGWIVCVLLILVLIASMRMHSIDAKSLHREQELLSRQQELTKMAMHERRSLDVSGRPIPSTPLLPAPSSTRRLIKRRKKPSVNAGRQTMRTLPEWKR